MFGIRTKANSPSGSSGSLDETVVQDININPDRINSMFASLCFEVIDNALESLELNNNFVGSFLAGDPSFSPEGNTQVSSLELEDCFNKFIMASRHYLNHLIVGFGVRPYLFFERTERLSPNEKDKDVARVGFKKVVNACIEFQNKFDDLCDKELKLHIGQSDKLALRKKRQEAGEKVIAMIDKELKSDDLFTRVTSIVFIGKLMETKQE